MSEGPIASKARAQLPATWDALARATQYGESALNDAITYVKYQVNLTVVDQVQEAALYNPTMITYLGKLVALQVIPAGIDYWSDQPIAETTTGTNESVTWLDRRDSLYRLYTTLQNEVRVLAAQVELVLGRRAVRRMSSPAISRAATGFVTPDPASFQPQRIAQGGGTGQ